MFCKENNPNQYNSTSIQILQTEKNDTESKLKRYKLLS